MLHAHLGAFRNRSFRFPCLPDVLHFRALVFFLSVTLATPSPLHAVRRILDIPSTMLVAEATVTLRPTLFRGQHTVQLRNFGPQGDALLYVLNSSHAQVGSGVAVNGVVSVTLNRSLSGQFLVVARSRSSTSVQTGDLWVDGRLAARGVKYTSGALLPLPNFTIGEVLEAVPPPLGAPDHIVYLLSADGARILRRGVGVATAVSVPGFSQNFVAVYATRIPQHARSVACLPQRCGA